MKKKIGIVIIIVVVVLFGGYQLIKKKPKTTTITHSDIEIVFNQELEYEELNGELYLYIPVNHEFKEIEIEIKKDGIAYPTVELQSYLLSLDTFIPGELIQEFELASVTVVIHTIVQ